LEAVSTTDVIATVALAISTASAVAAGLSLWLQYREASRRDEEIRLLRDEAGRRDEELLLLREQVEEARSGRLASERARLTVTKGAVDSSSRSIAYSLSVTNAGPRYATNVLLRLRDRDGRLAGETIRVEPILDGTTATIVVETPPRENYHGPYTVDLSWDDGRGRSQTTLRNVVLELP
jgi:hypothetical protein